MDEGFNIYSITQRFNIKFLMKHNLFQLQIGVAITVIAVFILTAIPIFIYANSGVLVTNSGNLPAGYWGYLSLNSPDAYITSFLFGIGTLPLIIFFTRGMKRNISVILWLLSSSWGLLLATFIGKLFGLSGVILIGVPVGVYISAFLLLMVYSYCTNLHFSLMEIGILSACGALLALVYSGLFGGLLFTGTWGGIPIFKMITIIAWHISMSLLLCIASFWKQKINRHI